MNSAKKWESWSIEQVNFVIKERASGANWSVISDRMLDKFDVSRKPDAIRVKHNSVVAKDIPDAEIIEQNVVLAKQKQKFQDKNRLERKSFREHARLDNAVSELNKELINVLKDNRLDDFTILHPDVDHHAAGIFHLTDLHFNELVDIIGNQYDFNIASKRLQKFVNKAKTYFKAANVTNVLIAMTGDMLNSSSRLDKLMNAATNRSKALFLGVEILEQVIIDLNEDFNVTIASVIGNESRMTDDVGFSDMMASENFDHTIFNILKYAFRGSKGVIFIDDSSATERIVNVAGQNVLLIHGNQKGFNGKIEHGIQSLFGKYSAKGINVDFVIFGHLHSAKVGSFYARGGSTVGANAYSDIALQLMSRASQNIHMLHEDGSRDSMVIDLQNYDGYPGYTIHNKIEAYDAKSSGKIHENVTIFKVVV